MTDNRLVCQSCDRPKQHLERRASKIAAGWNINMCQDCVKLKYEPKFLIILAVRQFGLTDKVIPYIKQHKYVGEDIIAEAILP